MSGSVDQASAIPDFGSCTNTGAARAMHASAVRQKQETVAALWRVELKAQLLIGYAVTFAAALAGRFSLVSPVAALVAASGAACLIAGAACAGTALRVQEIDLAESNMALFCPAAFSDKKQAERIVLLVATDAIARTSNSVADVGCKKGTWVSRAEVFVLAGTVFAILGLALLSCAHEQAASAQHTAEATGASHCR